MKKLIMGLVAALAAFAAANFLLLLVAAIGTITAVIVLARLTGLLN